MKTIRKKLNGILYDGGYDNFSVDSKLTTHSNEWTEQSKRASMAYTIATTPNTFEEFKKNNIVLFHGTNSNALPGILKYGMKSGDRLTKEGVEVTTGEGSTRGRGQRSFISFTDDLGTAIDYSRLLPSKQQDSLDSFGVVIGISKDDIHNLRICNVGSDVPEVGIKDSIPLEYIKSISVPADKVEFVKKMCNNDNIAITPLDLNEKFFSFYESQLFIDDQKFQEHIHNSENKKNDKLFTNIEVKSLTLGRTISRIREMYNRVKEKIQSKGRSMEYDTRTKWCI